MRDIIQCLIDWLESMPSDDKPHRILKALASESIKRVNLNDEEKLKFTAADIVAAARETPSTTDSKWINWSKTVEPFWKERGQQIINEARKRGLKSYPKPARISTKGYHQTVYLIIAEPLSEISYEAELEPSQEQLGKAVQQQTTILYEIAENGEVKPSWGAKWLFHDGRIRLSKQRMWAILVGLFLLFVSVVAFSFINWIVLSVPKPITTRDLTLLISIFVFPYAFWGFFIKPWLRMFEDRIVPAPELLISFQEKSAQLEVLRDGDLRLIRLVCYSATCPICGATIHLDDGSPDYPRRLVGRCYDSPREHIYSFDRVTQKGTVLRSPII
jgi:hypothetical protein